MTRAPDLLALLVRIAGPARQCCGTCVARQAASEQVEYGECPVGGLRHRADGACEGWFSLSEARQRHTAARRGA